MLCIIVTDSNNILVTQQVPGILFNALRSCSALFTLQVMCVVYGSPSCYMCLKSLCLCMLCLASLVYLVMNVHVVCSYL